jgi:chloramphenicol 3-O phosphotransferase
MPGTIILLNGASSAGKSTLARALQATLPLPFWHYSIDHLLLAGVLPRHRIDAAEFPWSHLRASVFEGFHRSIPAFVDAGNHLLVEHIVETRDWMNRLLLLLEGRDVFFVGLRCPVAELERRELARGDRRLGEARSDDAITHSFGEYDFEVQTTAAPEDNARAVASAWSSRSAPSAFNRMLARLRSGTSD